MDKAEPVDKAAPDRVEADSLHLMVHLAKDMEEIEDNDYEIGSNTFILNCKYRKTLYIYLFMITISFSK